MNQRKTETMGGTMKSKMTAIGLWIMALITLIGVDGAYALKAPHNADRSVSCLDCHLSGWQTRFKSRKPPCLDCHNPLYNGVDTAKKRYLTYESASNVFGTFTNVNNKKQTSHVWSVPETNSNAGATGMRTVKRNSRYTSGINCTNCHYAHGSSDQNMFPQPFIRQDKRGDGICLTCHTARHVGAGSARSYPPAAGKYYSHPVEVNYSSIRAAKPDLFEATPLNPYPSNPSAVLKLYTAFNFDSNGNAASVKAQKTVICSTCHGPLHAADSNPYTFDSLTGYSQGHYSTGDGYLLRRYNLQKSNDICISCHKVTAHKSYKCNRCHTPHKKQGENNLYLILENISTPSNGKRPVLFTSTSEMAARFAAGYSSTQSRFQRSVSNRICQVCHTATRWHKNYSAIGTTGKNREGHATPNEYLGGGKYRNCTVCHEHAGGFAVGGAACASCHGNPVESTPYPADTYGKHDKHVGKNTGGSYSWSGGTLSDDRQVGEYGFSCGRCHNPWTPYTASSVNALRHAGPAPGSLKNYTADIGFKNGTPLPSNQNGTYSFGGRGTVDTGTKSDAEDYYRFNTPSAGSCTNLYCHGQFFGGYTGNNPAFNGANARQSCNGGTGRVCHGTNATNIPGSPSESGTPVGAHSRHVGSGAQQYGQGSPNFRCNACHNATVGYNIQTSVTDKRFHVNGRINVRFAGAYGDGSSRYDTFNDYSVSPNAAGSPKAYKTCGLIYCHSDGTRTQGNYSAPFNAGVGTGSVTYPNWSSAGKTHWVNNRCSKCHGGERVNGGAVDPFTGVTAAMPAYDSRPGKGNSHRKHVVDNGFMCRVCHSKTVNTDNKSIYWNISTKHVNKTYDINIISSYGASATYNADKTCSNVKCHGNEVTPPWGNTAVCQDCHQSNTGDVNKRINSGTKWQSFTGVAPKIYSASWVGSGHGRTGANYIKSNNPAAGKTCSDCHGSGEQRAGGLSTKHGTGNNPFRLITAPDRPNFVCNRCHGVGGVGATKKDILSHMSSNTSTGPDSHNYEIKCIDCHDPHGDNNIFMVHSTVSRPNDATSVKDFASGRYGIITSNTTRAAVDFVNNVYTTDYAKKTTANRICQQCHNETWDPSIRGSNTRYRYNGTNDTNHGSDKCTGCHTHTSGFKGAGCSNCHGNPPVSTATLIGGGDNPGEPASSSATPGAHQKHIDALSGTATQKCSYCHQEGMYDSGSKNTDLDIGFKAFVTYTGSGQKYTGQTAVKNGFYGYSGPGMAAVDNNMRCNNMKCHGGGTSQWLTKSFGTPTAPKWNDPNTATCGKCHGAKKASNSGSWPTSKAHAKHAGTGNTGYNLECKLCHTNTVVSNWTTLNDTVHVNAEANVAFDTADLRVGSQSTYTAVGKLSVNATYGKCYTLYCHSRGTAKVGPAFDYGNFTADWNVNGSGSLGSYKQAAGTRAKCNYCHGNRSWSGVTSAMPGYANTSPKANRHEKHVKTYGFMCVRCHNGVVANNTSISASGKSLHINREYNVSFDSSNYTDYGKTATMDNTFAKYTLQTVTPFSKCKNAYCHSRGTDFTAPYSTRTSFANFTARWGDDLGSYKKAAGQKAKCNYCHGNRAYSGTTSAMPNYSTVKAKANSHRAHVVSNGLVCSVCHYGVARNNTAISDVTRHANRFYNISIAPGYGSGGAGVKRYSSAWNTSGGTCMNVTCHGTGKPKWGSSLGCRNCHLTTDTGIKDRDNYANWSGFKGAPAQIYSSEWGQKGHGSKGKDCSNCHNKVGGIVAHGAANNPYRLYTSDANSLCLDCHGSNTERGKWNAGPFGGMTGYQTHSKANINAAGATANASWNNYTGQSVKCVDCHDPHGDKNKKMIHAQVNYTGSDRYGRPVRSGSAYAVTQMTFTTPVGSTNWSSFSWINDTSKAICRRCHTSEANMQFMNKALYTGNHQPHQPCTNCHAHKKGFAPSGCDSCHGFPPPPGPSTMSWFDSSTSLHTPHANNPRNRGDIPGSGYECKECHGNSSNGQGTSHSNWSTAVMQQMTSTHGEWSRGGTKGRVSVIDDTCWNVNCHTPRAYVRSWKRPKDCDDCHGYTKGKGAANRVFNLQTTQSHKIHINWTGIATPPASWKKNYNFACKNCHYDWVTNNNYSTHYNGFVNITANGPINAVGNMKIGGGQFYTRDRSFNGFTTGNEAAASFGTCSRAYCHGNFANGTAITAPNWKKGVTTLNCNSCHRGKDDGADGSLMPERHPKHAGTAQYNFACARCHVRTVANNTTVQFNWSSHVNARKDTYFNIATTVDLGGKKFAMNNTNATFGGGNRACKNSYCHSKGTDRTAPFNTRTSFSNFTAQWGDNVASLGYKKPAGQKAKCNYCHGNRAYSGTTSAMPNYSGNAGAVKAKANSHRVHVISNGIVCSTCHNNIAMNNTSISDRSRHANGFYNISIAPAKRGASGLKVYSMVYDGTGGTCMNNTCHGSSNPKWGAPNTASCKACHLSSAQTDLDSYGKPGDNKTARLYSTEWGQKGHGAKGTTCNNCHDSNVAHGDITKNPFRLYTSDPNALCFNCHGAAPYLSRWQTEAGNMKGYKPHNKSDAQAGNAASWNNFQNQIVKCVDCHDPHGDKNKKMIQSFINHTGSDKFGRPTRADFSTVSSAYSAQMTFTTLGGQYNWSSFANTNVNNSICRRCHTPIGSDTGMGDASGGNMTKANYAGGSNHQASHQACTGCHDHKAGFKGGGESPGGSTCGGCHNLYSLMSNSPGYHHVMKSDAATYSSKTSFAGTAGDFDSTERRCLMCHVDHNIFRGDLNLGFGARAKNLRVNAWDTGITQGNSSDLINTDFWPAKRVGKYSQTNPVDGPAGSYGVCISCHDTVQYKNTTLQNNNQGRMTPKIAVKVYTSSSHNFQIRSGMNNFRDGSSFRANCSKCHGAYYINKDAPGEGQNGTPAAREKFGLHDSKYQSLNRPIPLNNTSYKNPMSKQLCYRCHGQGTPASGQRGTYDYYSTVSMDTSAKLIQTAIEAKAYGHPAGKFTGHDADELWTMSQGWMGNDGANKHIECTDCHNTHGGNASVTRPVGSPTGNKAAGAQVGVWGVKQTAWPTVGGEIPAFAKVTSVQFQYQLCAKCHSKFAWDTNTPPAYPSPGYNSYTGSSRMTDVMKEFNPNNYGFHPVVSQGKNQPAKTMNANWPTAKNNVRWYDAYNNVSGLANISGLDYSFVPPFNRRSTLGCTDCHQSDSTRLAIGNGIYNSTVSSSGWTNGPSLDDVDSVYATTSTNTVLEIDLKATTNYATGNPMEFVVVGKHNGSSAKTLNYKIMKGAVQVNTVTTLSMSKGATKEYRVNITTDMTTQSCLSSTCVNDNISVQLWGDGATTFSIDWVSVAGTFTMTDALRGPHGSMMQWILASANKDLYVDWGKNNNYTDAGDRVNDPTYIVDAHEERTFCWNCHRFRTYQIDATNGDYKAVEGKYSRFLHSEMVTVNAGHTLSAMSNNKWGIGCMQCHGGSAAGAIHGSWDNEWYLDATANNWGRPAGVRLLNGAGAHLSTVTAATSGAAIGDLVCYVVKAPASLGGCAGSGSPEGTVTSTIFNYSYTAYP